MQVQRREDRPGGAGKRGRDEELNPAQKRVRTVDYTSIDNRIGTTVLYRELAKTQIDFDFPMFYKKDVELEFWRNRSLYAPTFIKLYEAAIGNIIIPGLRKVTVRRRPCHAFLLNRIPDPEFDEELIWVHRVWKVAYDAKYREGKGRDPIMADPRRNVRPARDFVAVRHPAIQMPAAQVPAVPAPAVEVPAVQVPPQALAVPMPTAPDLPVPGQSSKIECACCYNDECSFDTMIQCSDAHLFCADCVRAQANVAVGARRRDILCMDASGCKQAFPASELRRCLDERTFKLWQRIVQADDIAAANLEGLEHCPSCDFAMIFEVSVDVVPLFPCRQSTCGLISCRRCKKKAHEGRCEDVEDAKLKKEHIVEEAMTKSMVRECPGCKVPFIKADGCNKIVCNNERCRAISCYVCRQVIILRNPYEHFDRQGTGHKCALWDGPQGTGTERRHQQEVEAAQQRERQRLAFV